MCSGRGRRTCLRCFEVSLFGDPRIEACLPAPRGLSQVTTSFIGSWCLGIHRLPLVACYYYKDARVHCIVLKIRAVSGLITSVTHRDPLEELLLSNRPFRTQQCAWARPSRFIVPLLQAGCTGRAESLELNGQCSTFRCLLSQRRLLWN